MFFRAGDIAACHGADAASRLIRWGTATPFAPRGLRVGPSHVAILSEHYTRPGMFWFESTSMCARPCVLTEERRNGTQAHNPVGRVDDYVNAGGRVDVYRLAPFWELSETESDELGGLLDLAVDQRASYDLPGAIMSGTRCLKYSRLLAADLDSLFCSELIAAVLQKLGLLAHANPMRFNPASLMRRLVRTGVYRLHRRLIGPDWILTCAAKAVA